MDTIKQIINTYQVGHCIDNSRRVYEKCVGKIPIIDKLTWKICYAPYKEELEKCQKNERKI